MALPENQAEIRGGVSEGREGPTNSHHHVLLPHTIGLIIITVGYLISGHKIGLQLQLQLQDSPELISRPQLPHYSYGWSVWLSASFWPCSYSYKTN